MGRITWLDSCRGLAILFLISIHYMGALESRGFISLELLSIIKSFFRVATPFFIFTFGFTFFVAYKKKVINNKLQAIYNTNLLSKLLYIVLAREIIAIILSFKSPENLEKLPQVLTFQSFSFGGEILIFYFFAILVAPLNLKLLLNVKVSQYIIIWAVTYGCAFFIGSTYITSDSHGALRFLFYDVYPFFPFLLVMAFGMLMAKLYQEFDNKKRLIFFSLTSVGLIIFGWLGFYSISSEILQNLADATYKAPPNIFYISFYVGITIFIIIVLATLNEVNFIPKSIDNILSTIGRYSLIAYVLHYTFYIASVIPKYLGKGVVWEVSIMLLMFVFSYMYIYWWDKYKKSKLN